MKKIVFAAFFVLMSAPLAQAGELYPVPQSQEIQFQTTLDDKMTARHAERAANAQYVESRLTAALQGEPYTVDCNDSGCAISWQEQRK